MAERTVSPTRTKTRKTAPVRKPTASATNATLASLIHRLEITGCKLDVASKQWTGLLELEGVSLGAAAITRDVARELDELYCAFFDWCDQTGFLRNPTYGELVEGFDLWDEAQRARSRG